MGHPSCILSFFSLSKDMQSQNLDGQECPSHTGCSRPRLKDVDKVEILRLRLSFAFRRSSILAQDDKQIVSTNTTFTSSGWIRVGSFDVCSWPRSAAAGRSGRKRDLMTATVLLVEDERKLRELVRSYLERAGFTVLSTGSGAGAISLAFSATPDLVVLDLGLPDVPGEAVAREIRAAGATPILMLTARSAEEDRIAGLELGADDYVTKPFSPRELVLRVQAVLRRGGPAAAGQGVSRFGSGMLVIDEQIGRASCRERV